MTGIRTSICSSPISCATAELHVVVVELALEHRPALIILDIMLPRVDGYTAVARLRGDPLTRHIPVVMISGRTELWFPLLSADMGTVAHLQKPFSPQQLLEAVRGALGPGGA